MLMLFQWLCHATLMIFRWLTREQYSVSAAAEKSRGKYPLMVMAQRRLHMCVETPGIQKHCASRSRTTQNFPAHSYCLLSRNLRLGVLAWIPSSAWMHTAWPNRPHQTG